MKGEHVLRRGILAFEGINKSPNHRLRHINGSRIYESEAGNLTGILVRRKFVGKLDVITIS